MKTGKALGPILAGFFVMGFCDIVGTVMNQIKAECALSDKTAARMNYDYNGSTSQGRIQLSVKTPGATLTDIVDGNLVAVRPYELGDTLTYYFGATWSEWSE